MKLFYNILGLCLITSFLSRGVNATVSDPFSQEIVFEKDTIIQSQDINDTVDSEKASLPTINVTFVTNNISLHIGAECADGNNFVFKTENSANNSYAFAVKNGGYLVTSDLNGLLAMPEHRQTVFACYGEVISFCIKEMIAKRPVTNVYRQIKGLVAFDDGINEQYMGLNKVVNAFEQLGIGRQVQADIPITIVRFKIFKNAFYGSRSYIFTNTLGVLTEFSDKQQAGLALMYAQNGHWREMLEFAMFCREGIGVPKNEEKANYWEREAALVAANTKASTDPNSIKDIPLFPSAEDSL